MPLIDSHRSPSAADDPARWQSLDVMRGLTVAAMLLVNNPGTWDAVYPPLRHAAWHGWTPTDLIFPFFLFIVGISTELSLEKRAGHGASDALLRRRILVRGGLIVVAGLLLHAFPFYPLTRITELRIPGVLQRIGVCYAIAGLVAWRRSDRLVGAVTAALLFGYWALLTLVNPPGVDRPTVDVPDQTIAAFLDRWLLDGHLWTVTKTWDPEGPLSTLPAIGTTLLGILTARAVRRAPDPAARHRWLLLAGTTALAIGWLWGQVFPINKNLWTSSYVVFTAGAGALALGIAGWLIEARRWIGWSLPLMTFGRNPLIAFLGSGMMARIIGSLIVIDTAEGPRSLQRLIFDQGFGSWLPPRAASLGYAVSFVGVWFLVLRVLEKRGWFLKI
ncbi:MAG: acyltransferase family protein [Gemmatimonadales bacterium]